MNATFQGRSFIYHPIQLTAFHMVIYRATGGAATCYKVHRECPHSYAAMSRKYIHISDTTSISIYVP